MSPSGRLAALAAVLLLGPGRAGAQYVNFESSQVHPVDLTPSGSRLLVVNTPDARLEVFRVAAGGRLTRTGSIPVGLEPVSVAARTETEAWVVNHLSDSVSVVDLALGATLRTLPAGDEPTDVAFARGRAYVTSSQEDALRVFDLADLALPPVRIDLFGRNPRALAVSPDGGRLYAIAQNSGNQTTVVNANVILGSPGLNGARLAALGLNTIACDGAPPPYPPLPPGVQRNPALSDPAPPAQPPVGLIVGWDEAAGAFRDEAGQSWSHCLPFRLPDHDLFVLDANSPFDPNGLSFVDHLGTTLFEVSVNPSSGKIYVPNTDARNRVRFEHPLGVTGRVVANQVSIVDPAAGHLVTRVDLNGHIDPTSDPATNQAERLASISQPGMMVWNAAGTRAYLTAIGSRKLFRLDGGCASPGCIFGASRAVPDAVEVGEGPTGVALHEGVDRLYVLNRFSNSIAVVAASSLAKLEEIPLHDPSSATIRSGRRFLYDGILSSRHGDAACSSCHISGDRDELAWDLGSPQGSFAPYGTQGDNVRFIIPLGNQPVDCNPGFCAAHDGFDPQKGPMTTQTLRGMLEPLHWRGDRGTMNAFNKAFVGLLGAHDIGPVNGEPAGLSQADMEAFRQFALDIRFPPNPYRALDDTEPNVSMTVPHNPFAGNPAVGRGIFLTGGQDGNTDAGQACVSCHALPFGAAGGKPGGLEPGDPPSARAALFNGTADGSPHSDVKVPHLRNMLDKVGPRFGLASNPADRPDARSGFGFVHDGSIPDMGTFLSASVFNLTAQEVRDLSLFMFLFPTGIRPSVGVQVTVPGGAPPTGTPAQESLVASLIGLGNLADSGRHCELTASATSGGRLLTWSLDGGAGMGGLWSADVDGEGQVGTTALRASAAAPITFLCATLGSGVRLGVDLDSDGHRNGSDCADGDPSFFASPVEVAGVTAAAPGGALLAWEDQAAQVGGALFYEVVGGSLAALRASRSLQAATACLAGGLEAASWDDPRPAPPPGDAHYYLIRARTSECTGGFGAGGGSLEALDCSSF